MPPIRKRKPWDFERLRRLTYQRHKAQALFRKEEYAITEEYWNTIWTEERFNQRGMRADCLCLVRRDVSKPWAQGNLMLMTRKQQLAINNKAWHNLPVEHLYADAHWRDDQNV